MSAYSFVVHQDAQGIWQGHCIDRGFTAEDKTLEGVMRKLAWKFKNSKPKRRRNP